MVNIELDESNYTYLLQLLNKRYTETDDLSEKTQLNNVYKILSFNQKHGYHN